MLMNPPLISIKRMMPVVMVKRLYALTIDLVYQYKHIEAKMQFTKCFKKWLKNFGFCKKIL